MQLMDNQFTIIRYHIYRELAKYRKMQEQKSSAIINEFAVPVLSGIVVGIAVNAFSGIHFECSVLNYIFMFAGPIFLYVIILIVLKRLMSYYETVIKPNVCSVINKSKKDFRRNEEYHVAKFNYEVTYLTKIAYNYSLEEYNDIWLTRMSILETCFHARNALRKISSSILLADLRLYAHRISSNRVYVVMGMLHAALKNVGDKSLYSDEVEVLKNQYDSLKMPIEQLYDIKIPSFYS